MKRNTTSSKNSFQKQSARQKSKASTTGLWVDKATLLPCSETHPSKEHFDSYLELEVYRHLITVYGIEGVKRQMKIEVATIRQTGVNIAWTPDFYIPSINAYIEAKGAWINRPDCRTEKALFLWQYGVACELLGNNVYLVSNEDFEISGLPVPHYSVIE